MSGESKSVRPTRICVEALGLRIPAVDASLADLDHILIKEAQRTPEAHAAAVIRLQESEETARNQPIAAARWWLGAGGYRRNDDPADFYAMLSATADRDGCSD